MPAAEALLAASGPATPSMAPLPNSSGCLASAFSVGVGEEGADLGAAGGHGADGEADEGAAQPRLPRARPVLARHPDRALHRLDLSSAGDGVRGDVERLADGEHGDGERRHLDAVEQVGHAEGEPRLPGQQVDADEPERQADEQRGEPAQRRIAEGGGDGDEGQHHQREILARPEGRARTSPPRAR